MFYFASRAGAGQGGGHRVHVPAPPTLAFMALRVIAEDKTTAQRRRRRLRFQLGHNGSLFVSSSVMCDASVAQTRPTKRRLAVQLAGPEGWQLRERDWRAAAARKQ